MRLYKIKYSPPNLVFDFSFCQIKYVLYQKIPAFKIALPKNDGGYFEYKKVLCHLVG